MRKFLLIGALAAFAAPAALADTLQNVTTKGVILTIQGMEVPISYKADGTFTGEAMGSQFAGKWRIDGAKLCTVSDLSPDERCTEYPAGKNPGDSFELTGPQGSVTIKINP